MKRSLRDYLVTLTLAVFVFAIVAVFLIQAAEGLMSDVVDKIGSEGETTQTETVEPETLDPVPQVSTEQNQPATKEEDKVLTVLVLGLDYNKQHADAIFLVGINATKKQMTMALIPCNTVVPEESGKYELGALYSSRSINFYKEFVQTETGILADRYVAMPTSAVANLVDILGGINYNVPENMYYFDPAQNLKINLSQGEQTLTGDGVVQLLSYRGYKGGMTQREETHLGFIRSFCTNFLTPANLSRASAIWNNIYYNCQTDFELVDLNQWGEVIFNVTSFSQNYTRIPGAKSGSFYAISTSRAKALFEAYK